MIHPLTPAIQHYAWGGDTFLKNYCDSTETPIAELWYGAHPSAPASIDGTPLNIWLSKQPTALSAATRQRYQTLPYLLKLLDVRLPLSIQVHPSKTQAEQGHRSKPELYPDASHKPESMCALSDFWLLHGFADNKTIETRLSARPSLAEALEIWRTHDAPEAYRQLLSTDKATLARWLNPILDAPAPPDLHNPDYWIHAAVRDMHIDRAALDAGLLSFYLFNIVQIKPGEGIFQKARLPHAYLRGQNIEIMAASDNVLRAGLTPKTVTIDAEVIASGDEGGTAWAAERLLVVFAV